MLGLANGSESTLLTWMTFIPVIGAAIIAMLPSKARDLHRWVALATAAIPIRTRSIAAIRRSASRKAATISSPRNRSTGRWVSYSSRSRI